MPSSQQRKSNIVLVGMPGSGKSTIGVLLAKALAKDFMDTDLLIQSASHRSLQDIVDQEGYMALRRIEEEVLLGIELRDHVISTGGSAVYSDSAMRHLKEEGLVVFLDVSLPVLEERLGDFSARGIAKRPEQSFEDLFQERRGLYLQYADLHVDCERLGHDEVLARVMAAIGA